MTLNAFLSSFARDHAPDGGLLYEVNGDNNYVGLLVAGSRQTVLDRKMTELGITMPCGNSLSWTMDELPAQDVPCNCEHVGHQVLVYTEVPSVPPEPETAVAQTVPEDTPAKPTTTTSTPRTRTK